MNAKVVLLVTDHAATMTVSKVKKKGIESCPSVRWDDEGEEGAGTSWVKTAKTEWGTHYSPGVNRAASFEVETDDGPGQNRKDRIRTARKKKKGGEA